MCSCMQCNSSPEDDINDECPECEGTGGVRADWDESEEIECPWCNGTGMMF